MIAGQKSTAAEKTEAGGAPPRYAVVFRTHFWDDFTQRQYDRLCERVRSGDVYVLVDETRGPVDGIPGRVFGLSDQQILAAGFPATEGSLQWFSGDVPMYMFHAAHSDYDYYLQLEFDVSVHRDIDELIAEVARDGVDFVALTKRDTSHGWMWMESCTGVYDPAEVKHQLICLSIYSRGGLQTLADARLEQAEQLRSGAIASWPFCEAFLAIEAGRRGLRTSELSRYGDVDEYDWGPPNLEDELPHLSKHTFVHPVLDRAKFAASMLKLASGPRTLLLPTHAHHRRLFRLGVRGYLRVILSRPFWTASNRLLRTRVRRALRE